MLEETSGRDLAAWSRAWLETAGVNSLTPQVDLRRRRAGSPSWPSSRRRRPRTRELRPHRVAVGLYRRRTRRRAGARRARRGGRRRGADRRRRSWSARSGPTLVLVNDDDLTYCKIRFDEGSLATAARPARRDRRPAGARAVLVRAVEPDPRRADARPRLPGSGAAVRGPGDRHRRAAVAARPGPYGAGALLRAGPPRERRPASWPRARCASCGWPSPAAATSWPGPGTSPRSPRPRPISSCCRACWTGTAKIDGLEVDQELRWTFLAPLASHGVADEAAIDAELARDDTASGKRHQVRCLAARPVRRGQGRGLGGGGRVRHPVERAGGGDDQRVRAARAAGAAGAVHRRATSR